jgi:DNA mismatch repair protein MutS2
MDSKTLHVLEYNKILDRLSGYCDFSASKELVQAIQPTAHLDEAQRLLAETTEARFLFSTRDLSVGGSHDIRPAADLAARGGVLEPQALLDVKSTLIACRELKKALLGKAESKETPDSGKPKSRKERLQKKAEDEAQPKEEHPFPYLAEIVVGLPDTHGLVSAISQVLSERGDVLDSASPKLASIRREQKISHDRLMSKLQKYITEA